MSKIFFDELGMKEPDHHLGVGSGSHGVQTGQILQRVEEMLGREMPDVLMVYGDTNSTLGGALAGVKLDIPVVHVEAGLRSFNKHMPEEVNRLLTDHISTLLLCPSELAVKNLVREGFSHIQNDGKLIPLDGLSQENRASNLRANKSSPLVINVGDVMYDVLLHSIIEAEKYSGIMEELGLNPKEYYLLTLHRAENTDDPNKLDELINFGFFLLFIG
jgi:UDP-N-acetylglucosamine 2-epimerase